MCAAQAFWCRARQRSKIGYGGYFIETPNPPPNDSETDPPNTEWSEDNYPYKAWTNETLFDIEEDFEPPSEHDAFIVELLERAHKAGIVDNSDILSLGVGVPEIIKRLKERTAEQGRDFGKIFEDFDIS